MANKETLALHLKHTSGQSHTIEYGVTKIVPQRYELVENRLFGYADDSTLLAVVRKPADIPAVAASVNRDLARIL